ncbi:MAG: S24/S26 family peptidase [Ruminococcus sp.]|nr:S24/S26 family peptidase [Ruminococcus sp.]
MAKSSFEQVIAERGELIYTNIGDSMYPLIQPRDLLVIKKPELPLRRLDIPLYKRDSGQYVLHRIIKVRQNDYVICGDNRNIVEEGITDRHIIGVLTAIVRKGKMKSVYSAGYRIYAHLWCDLFPVRCFILRVLNRLHALKR